MWLAKRTWPIIKCTINGGVRNNEPALASRMLVPGMDGGCNTCVYTNKLKGSSY